MALVDLDVSAAPPRVAVTTGHGQLLLMPGESKAAAGVKVLSIAPGNPARGLPRAQGVFVLFDAETLTPRAVLDGAALTTLRTPAVSALAVRHLAAPDASALTVFGSGPQAEAHVHAIRAVRPIETVTIVGRTGAAALVDRLHLAGIDACVGSSGAVSEADIVVCATSARTPVFDGGALRATACIVAIGSHEPEARELDDEVFRRAARVVVEDRATALREAGDVIMAVAAGALNADDLADLSELPTAAATGGITVFKSVGMGWQDLVIAAAIVAR
jgi:ornithine cyclodeaminase/alanine dehydrogenase-like protein (mu-crystallin family)